MRVEPTRLYRVKDVAGHFDVSVSTIYRAIESGRLCALKLGAGLGTLRVEGSAVLAYAVACGEAVYGACVTELRPAQARGVACVLCGGEFSDTGVSRVPVGRTVAGAAVFACGGHGVQALAAGELVGEVSR